ncbi:GDSL esterase/lipase [Camellia lanceoleosa]|uniref:GDSL esterase/lipase n=1 Tax=Camellia lanceoleosa TaxID=1840588 RepID=A0ACC0GJ49_9ERIC|nr:GDSL esterase/lipase [Camellia lanceoleosa]
MDTLSTLSLSLFPQVQPFSPSSHAHSLHATGAPLRSYPPPPPVSTAAPPAPPRPMLQFLIKIWFMVSIISLVASLQPWVHAKPEVPCFFIFGDSLADNGNNNVGSSAKSNYQPYGIDFPEGPTGRFCNGRTISDIIAEHLGFDDFIPSFARALDRDILMGVNYASGGAGIRNETGRKLGFRISMYKQLLNHQIIISRIAMLLGSKEAATNHLSKCIYSVGMGNNDYINNYFQPQYYPTSSQYTGEQYATVLVQQYSKQLKTLHEYGANKIAIFGLGQIGCTPAEIAVYGTNGFACVDKINSVVEIFNVKLKSLVDDLNKELAGVKFIYINITSITSGKTSPGLTVLNVPCCNVSSITGLCVSNKAPCSNRSTYAFWDAYHPTEIVNVFVAGRAYNAQTTFDASPIDIHSLAQL